MTAIRRLGLVFIAATVGASVAHSASFGDLSGDAPSQVTGPGAYGSGPYAPGPYAAVPYGAPPAYGPGPYAPPPISSGAEGVPPALDASGDGAMTPMPGTPTPYPAYGPNPSLPPRPLQAETFGQVNSTTDPFNPWGLSTPFMFVPWSTPLSGWANAQTWNWWRERSGALPRNW